MNHWQRSSTYWEEIERNLLKRIPFVEKDLNGRSVESFVQKAVKRLMTQAVTDHPFASVFSESASFDCETFETQRSVFVQCRFAGNALPSDLKLLASRTKLKIETGGRTEVVPLPADIIPSRTIARFRQGVLEIRMPKSTEPETFREIFIREEDSFS